ncbi:hypothetical protein [Bartonella sp. OT172YNZD]|uniref:hypothetical protein n=1 Tax=Bartonella sp. OT172YNZD TaxID=3243572 RepID=UPI0035CF1F88
MIIDNVAAGRVKKGSREAVKGDQLHDYMKKQTDMILDKAKEYMNEKVSNIVKDGVKEVHSYTEIKFAALSHIVEDIRKEARQAAAIGLAVSDLSYENSPGKISFSFGREVAESISFCFGVGYNV